MIYAFKERELFKYLLKLSHLYSAKELVSLLATNPQGISFQELIRSGVDPDDIQQFQEDSLMDEYYGKFRASVLLDEVLRVQEDNDVIITVRPRCENITHAMRSYRIRKLTSSSPDTEEILKNESKIIINKLRDLYSQTKKELDALEKEIDNKYVNETNWSIKKDILETADKKIIEIQYLIWINCKETKGNDCVITPSLIDIIENDKDFYPDNKDQVDGLTGELRILMSISVCKLRNKIAKNIGCVQRMIDTMTDYEKVFIGFCINNSLNKGTHGMLSLLKRFSLPPESHRTNTALNNNPQGLIALESICELNPVRIAELTKNYDLENFQIRKEIPKPDNMMQMDIIEKPKPDINAIIEELKSTKDELINIINKRYPEQDNYFRYTAYLLTAYRLLDSNKALYDDKDMENGYRNLDENHKCLNIKHI